MKSITAFSLHNIILVVNNIVGKLLPLKKGVIMAMTEITVRVGQELTKEQLAEINEGAKYPIDKHGVRP